MPIYGKLANIFGRRKMYLIGLFLLLAASVLCGNAGSITELILFRGIQGLGTGALMPITFAIVGDIYPPEIRGKFMVGIHSSRTRPKRVMNQCAYIVLIYLKGKYANTWNSNPS
ncbi:MFS transporter [Paenibacillus apii]|uniref:MFS transporter n=1 Tax=Paenibacillus apii TaxID=1850370 RepID=UPI0039A48C0D